jgi:hypothetical protein
VWAKADRKKEGDAFLCIVQSKRERAEKEDTNSINRQKRDKK